MPTLRDPRTRLAIVIVVLQVLGQVGLGFKVSIAQIVLTVAACGAVEVAWTYWRRRAWVWPASALLTGNSTAFILRVNGTHHGDWWATTGIEFFLLAGVGGLVSKWLFRPGGRHAFNPSNVGLVAVLLLAGPAHVYPQYLWWGAISVWTGLALGVIVLGGLWILRSLRMLSMVAVYLAALGLLVGGLALAGACFIANWASEPVCGVSHWLDITLSPEVLVFVFFMISDPKTAPDGGSARAGYALAAAGLAAAMIAFQPTEYGVKVAILAALTMVCAAISLLRMLAQRQPVRRLLPVTAVAIIVGIAAPLGVHSLASNPIALAIDSPARPGFNGGSTTPVPRPSQ